MFALLLLFFCSLVAAQPAFQPCHEYDPTNLTTTFAWFDPGTVTANEVFAITAPQALVETGGLEPESDGTSLTPPNPGDTVLPNLVYIGCDFDSVNNVYYFIYEASAPGNFSIPFFNNSVEVQAAPDNITAMDTTTTTAPTTTTTPIPTTTTARPTSTPPPKNCHLFPEQCVTTPAPPAPTPPCPTPPPPCPTPPPAPTPPCPTPPTAHPPTTTQAPTTTAPIAGPASFKGTTPAPTKAPSSILPGIKTQTTTTTKAASNLAKAASPATTTHKPTTHKPTTKTPTTTKKIVHATTATPKRVLP